MINPFLIQSEFIDEDIRNRRPKYITTTTGTYNGRPVDQEYMFKKNAISLPSSLIKDKTVLDIGSCIGATGAYVLSNGARKYTGIEMQPAFVDISNRLLSKYYDITTFEIFNRGLEDFHSNEKFDIVICAGVLYAIFDTFSAVSKLTSLAKETIIIESLHPFHGYKSLFKDKSSEYLHEVAKEICIIESRRRSHMVDARAERSLMIVGSYPSLNSLVMMFENLNWQYDSELYDQAEQQMPEAYNLLDSTKFMAKFVFNKECNKLKYFKEEITKDSPESIAWRGNLIKK